MQKYCILCIVEILGIENTRARTLNILTEDGHSLHKSVQFFLCIWNKIKPKIKSLDSRN